MRVWVFFGDAAGDREVGLLSDAVRFVGCFLVLHSFEGLSVTCCWPSDFGGFAQLVLVLSLEMIRFLDSGTVLPLSLRLVAVLGAGGNMYSGRSFLSNSLNPLISFR